MLAIKTNKGNYILPYTQFCAYFTQDWKLLRTGTLFEYERILDLTEDAYKVEVTRIPVVKHRNKITRVCLIRYDESDTRALIGELLHNGLYDRYIAIWDHEILRGYPGALGRKRYEGSYFFNSINDLSCNFTCYHFNKSL